MGFTFTQKSKIITQGTQRLINISNKFHDQLKEMHLLGKDLKITVTLDDDIEIP